MKKRLKPGRKYIIINVDELYAPAVYEILKKGQTVKGQWPEGNISFNEWIKRTWPEEHLEELRGHIRAIANNYPSSHSYSALCDALDYSIVLLNREIDEYERMCKDGH